MPKCVLASPAVGHRLQWCKILHQVKAYLKRLADGDIATLWAGAVAGGQALLNGNMQEKVFFILT